MFDTRLVIYKTIWGYEVTIKSNYDAPVKDARLIQKLYDFKSPEEIMDYYEKYFQTDRKNFIIV
jgi:hypothetical protein